MKSLGLSLVLVVIVAVIGIGWLVTELDLLTSEVDVTRNTEVGAYEHMVLDLARTLDGLPDKQAFLTQWQQQSELRLTLAAASAFPVPSELKADFEAGGAMVLESQGSISIHAWLPRSGEVLSLVLPDTVLRDAQLRPSLLLTLLFYVGVVAAILLWLYPLVKRLLLLRITAQAFGRGDLRSRVAPSRFSTIDAIEKEFNYMADRIQTLIADNKLLGQAVSHNLKTPLARLRFGLDALAEAEDEATREKYAQRISKDLADMEALVETLLQYAKLDEANVQLQKQRIELNAFVAHLVAGIDNVAPTIECRSSGGEVFLTTDPTYFALQLNNLLGNAQVYARTRITVSVLASDTVISIVVEDDGGGIPAAEREAVLEPFRRGSNSTGARGHGMGLAIVARIAKWLDGKVCISDSADLGGAAVSLEFRTAQSR